MTSRTATEEGLQALGRFLLDSMESFEQRVTIEKLVEMLADQGHQTNSSYIERLRNRLVRKGLKCDFVWALACTNVLKKPSGKPYSHEEILMIICGNFDPYEEIRLAEAEGTYIYNTKAVQFIRRLITASGQDPDTEQGIKVFAKQVGIEISRFQLLLRGQIPTWEEFLSLSRFMDDGNPAPLVALYRFEQAQPKKRS
jgi:hypothetical protein